MTLNEKSLDQMKPSDANINHPQISPAIKYPTGSFMQMVEKGSPRSGIEFSNR